MAIESLFPIPLIRSGPNLADWAEAIMLIEGRARLPRAALRRRLTGALLSSGDDEDDMEVSLDMLMSEIAYRRRLAPSSYPFTERLNTIHRVDGVDPTLYEFLLWIAGSPYYRRHKRFSEIEPLFDDVASMALESYLGDGARSVVFAAASAHRPSGFRQAVRWLADQLNLPAGVAPLRPKVKDGGVDVVAWKPFMDERAGFAVLLCQTTVQQMWVPKAKDIIIRRWTGWIDFGWEPLTVLVIPFAVPRGFDQWDDLRRTVAIVLDRFRLCELVRPDVTPSLPEMRRWCDSERLHLGTVT